MPVRRIASGVPVFTRVEDYTTFIAEHTMKDDDLVIHFYPTEESNSYWTSRFPEVLDRVAQAYFRATSPRLQAKFTHEVNSWWFRARGYSHIPDMNGFISGFFDALDQGLETAVQ
jgi:hypothetical protein